MNAKHLLLATALATAALSAQATVSTSVAGNPSTRTANFNGGGSFSYLNALFTSDSYLGLSKVLAGLGLMGTMALRRRRANAG